MDIAFAAIFARARFEDRFVEADPDVVAVLVAVASVNSVAVSSRSSTTGKGCEREAAGFNCVLLVTGDENVFLPTDSFDVVFFEISPGLDESVAEEKRVTRSVSDLVWRGGVGDGSSSEVGGEGGGG